jgi:hypothetical protein
VTAARQQPLPLRPAGAPAARPLAPVLPRVARLAGVPVQQARLNEGHDHGR